MVKKLNKQQRQPINFYSLCSRYSALAAKELNLRFRGHPMEISGVKLALSSQNPIKVQVRPQATDGILTTALAVRVGVEDTVTLTQAGMNALAASTGTALHKQSTSETKSTQGNEGDEALSPVEKQIKNLKEKIKELKEQLRELRGDNSEQAVEKRKQIQQEILINNGMIAALTKQLDENSVTNPLK
jgi:pyruvate/oxaloacetate carboxyltransferase